MAINKTLKKRLSGYFKQTVDLQRNHPELKLVQYNSLINAYQYYTLFASTLRYIDGGMKLLDWGCGNGHFSFFLCSNGFKPTMYSFDEKPPILDKVDSDDYTFVKGKPDEPRLLPFPDNSFEAVFSVGVLEHVREYQGDEISSLKEISRILKKNGLFICSHIPNKLSWKEFISNFIPGMHYHEFRYTKSEIIRLLDNVPLNLIKIKKYGFLPRGTINRMCTAKISNSPKFTQLYNTIDHILSIPLYPFLQNYIFIGEKQ